MATRYTAAALARCSGSPAPDAPNELREPGPDGDPLLLRSISGRSAQLVARMLKSDGRLQRPPLERLTVGAGIAQARLAGARIPRRAGASGVAELRRAPGARSVFVVATRLVWTMLPELARGCVHGIALLFALESPRGRPAGRGLADSSGCRAMAITQGGWNGYCERDPSAAERARR